MNHLLRFQDVVYFLIDLPLRVWSYGLRRLGLKAVFSNNAHTSDSDSTEYSNVVDAAVSSESKFRKFRRNFYYRQILEHVNFILGLKYLKKLSDENKGNLKLSSEIHALSKVGSPRKYFYRNLGTISPTIIRYQYVEQEIQRLFGNLADFEVAEIGVGFGGQYVILQRSHKVNKYVMFDLPQVIALTHKVLTAAKVDLSHLTVGDIGNPHIQKCDLVISNYAFSELPRDIQQSYVVGIMQKAKRGYLIMNSGRSDISGRSSGKLDLDELEELLPKFEIFEEDPLTGPDNYIIVWGHQS